MKKEMKAARRTALILFLTHPTGALLAIKYASMQVTTRESTHGAAGENGVLDGVMDRRYVQRRLERDSRRYNIQTT